MNDESVFTLPQRQSFQGVFVLFFTDLLKRFKQNIYIIVLPFINEKIRTDYLWLFFALLFVLIILQLLYSYKYYLNYQFYIRKDAFCLDYGVFKKSNLEIPFYRIQNISIEQNLAQKILGVVGLKIDTAGATQAEVKIKALSSIKANSLKQELIEIREKTTDSTEVTLNDKQERSNSKSNSKVVLKLSISQLLKVGVSSNFFKGIGIIFLVITSTYDLISDLFGIFYEEDDFHNQIYNSVPKTISFTFIFITFLLILVFLITVISAILKYYHLKVISRDDGFEVNYGLFNRQSKFIKVNKTQIIEWETNPIKRLFNISNVYVSQASSGRVNQNKKIGIVGVNYLQFNEIFYTLFNKQIEQDFSYTKSNFRYLFRLFWFQVIMTTIFLTPTYFIFSPLTGYIVGSLIFLFTGWINYLRVKKSYIGFNEHFLKIGSGSIHTKTSYLPCYKIVSTSAQQSIIQKKSQLTDLVIYTAAGSKTIRFIPYHKAVDIMNKTNYYLHQSKKEWM